MIEVETQEIFHCQKYSCDTYKNHICIPTDSYFQNNKE